MYGEGRLTFIDYCIKIFFFSPTSISTYFLQIGGGEVPDETTLHCLRGSDRFANFHYVLPHMLMVIF